jgi:hypothetical protein
METVSGRAPGSHSATRLLPLKVRMSDLQNWPREKAGFPISAGIMEIKLRKEILHIAGRVNSVALHTALEYMVG